MIICGFLILFFDVSYNLLHKPTSISFYSISGIIFGFFFILSGIAQDKIIYLLKKIGKLFETKTYHVLFVILAASILIRLLFLPERWINPDEGAHLYDAKFILDGNIPFGDPASRMPVYVYSLAAFLKLFGVSFMMGRLLSLFSNIGVGIMIFLLGKKLFDSSKIALLASLIYLFSPLSIIWSVVVKDEMPETLFVMIGFFLLLTFIKSEHEKYYMIFFSGFFFAIAYYVRESSIALFSASIFVLIYSCRLRIGKIVKTSIVMFSGYIFVVFLILFYLSNFAGLNAIMDTKLNPIETISDPINKIMTVSEEISNGNKTTAIHQPFDQTIEEWIWVMDFDSFLLLGALIFFIGYFSYNKKFLVSKFQFIFLSFWLFALVIFYIYFSIRTSFFTPYFGEFLPVLSLILAYVIVFLISAIETKNTSLGNNAWIGLTILIALYISSLTLLNISFGSKWSPDTVNEISQYIRSNSVKDDVVLSGAMIWQFESNTRPFMNRTHPLGYLRGMSDNRRIQIENQIKFEKPVFIVMDGYTEKIFLENFQSFGELINSSYTMKKEVYGKDYSVKVYGVK